MEVAPVKAASYRLQLTWKRGKGGSRYFESRDVRESDHERSDTASLLAWLRWATSALPKNIRAGLFVQTVYTYMPSQLTISGILETHSQCIQNNHREALYLASYFNYLWHYCCLVRRFAKSSFDYCIKPDATCFSGEASGVRFVEYKVSLMEGSWRVNRRGWVIGCPSFASLGSATKMENKE